MPKIGSHGLHWERTKKPRLEVGSKGAYILCPICGRHSYGDESAAAWAAYERHHAEDHPEGQYNVHRAFQLYYDEACSDHGHETFDMSCRILAHIDATGEEPRWLEIADPDYWKNGGSAGPREAFEAEAGYQADCYALLPGERRPRDWRKIHGRL